MDNSTPQAYVLVKGSLDSHGNIAETVVGVTFNIHDADAHKNASFENDVKGPFPINADWQEDAATSDLVTAMRDFRGMVAEMQAEALR